MEHHSEASGSLEDLEIIQEEDTHPSENISSHHDEGDQEIDEPQSDIILIHRSTRTRHAPDRMCLNIKADEYALGDLNEPANYKAALLDPVTPDIGGNTARRFGENPVAVPISQTVGELCNMTVNICKSTQSHDLASPLIMYHDLASILVIRPAYTNALGVVTLRSYASKAYQLELYIGQKITSPTQKFHTESSTQHILPTIMSFT
ncbi:hypothetical protein Tco_0717019 [Tanacetum coccineum]